MTKKLLSAAILSIALTMSVNSLKAQETDVTTPFNLNIVLQDAISIDLGATPDVTFTYGTAAAYASANTIEKTGHFTVVSNRAYDITVNAAAEFNLNGANTTPVALGIVNINVLRTGMEAAVGGGDVPAVLALTPQPLVNGANPTTTSVFNVSYSIPSAVSLVGKAIDTYTTTVTYTATQI